MAEKVIPTENELQGFDLDNPEIIELIAHAKESDAADRQLTIKQALKKYKKAAFWAMFLSTSLIMEGYDLVIVSSLPQAILILVFLCPYRGDWRNSCAELILPAQITSFYGQTQFQQRFGVYDENTRQFLITPAWQSGLSNSALVGQLAGLCINAYAQDRFGCRPTMMLFMVWMAMSVFIPVFAPSLPVLAFGEAMCGVSWGVFQVCLRKCIWYCFAC